MGLFDSGNSLTLGNRWLMPVKLSERDRRHTFFAGKSGTGKTSELYNLILQDIKNKRGVGLIDVHSDLTKLLEKAIYHLIPKEEQRERVIILDPTRKSFGFNPLEVPNGESPHQYILGLQEVFEIIWKDFLGPRMADILINTNLVMAEKNLTMGQINRFLTDPACRRSLIRGLKDPKVKEYWEHRFGNLPPKEQSTWVESTLNKVNRFVNFPMIRNIVGQRKSTIDFRKIMDNPKGSILLINLPKGKMKENYYILGSLLISKIQEAALSRVDVSQKQRKKFFLYIDEAQNFANDSSNFEEILSESRKYGLFLTLAHQNLDQMDPKVLSSILANTDCQMTFRPSRKDAEVLAKQLFKIDLDEIQWRRDNEKPYLNLSEQWEENFNALMRLEDREAYVVIKGRDAQPMRSVDAKFYQVSDQELKKQAEYIMAPYTKSEEEIKKEQEQLNQEIEPKGPKFKG